MPLPHSLSVEKKIHRTNNVANVLWLISKGVAISFEAEFFIIVLLWVKDPSESFAVKKVQMQSKILCHLWVNIVQGWVLFNAQ